MREILFKAKRLDNGEWIIGNLVVSKDAEEGWKAIIIPTFDSNMFTKGGAKGDLGFENWHRVEENTICQYTGLTDKNGNKIWENDVVIGDFGYVKGRYTIRWFGSKAKFDFPTDATICEYEYEVIGNIFDNPELLKGGGENE